MNGYSVKIQQQQLLKYRTSIGFFNIHIPLCLLWVPIIQIKIDIYWIIIDIIELMK